MKVGYRRISTVEQKFDRQEHGELDKLFEEKVSVSSSERLALNEMIDFVRQDDEVVVYSIDRLARNLKDLQNIIEKLNSKVVSIKFLSENLTFSLAYSSSPISIIALLTISVLAVVPTIFNSLLLLLVFLANKITKSSTSVPMLLTSILVFDFCFELASFFNSNIFCWCFFLFSLILAGFLVLLGSLLTLTPSYPSSSILSLPFAIIPLSPPLSSI